jgi:hypothetical protein
MAVLASIHLTLFASFGSWLWITIRTFGDHGNNVDCEIPTHLIIFGAAIPVISPTIRSMFLLVYVLCILPLINIIVCVALGFIVVYALYRVITFRRRRSQDITDRSFFYSAVFLTFLSQLYFILCTEFTIKNNQHLLKQGDTRENDWTFGQTLAVALTAIPLLEVYKSLKKVAYKS